MSKPVDLGNQISLIDLYDLGLPQRTGSYVIQAEELTIIETSASPSVPYLLEGLQDLGLKPEDVHHIIVTHIHLDHAGGVGLLLESCPNATVYVHPRGKRHLIDPSKLIKGAQAVYGDRFDELFDPIVPVPEERLVAKDDGDTLDIGFERRLTFYDSPGHAKHHFSIHDSLSNGIFTGDTIGVFYPQVKGVDFVLPSTSPNQFDPDAMLASLQKIEDLDVDTIFFGHFGKSDLPDLVYQQIREWLPKFVEEGEKVLTSHKDSDMNTQTRVLIDRLNQMVMSYLDEQQLDRNDLVNQLLKMDMDVCAMGLIDYLHKKVRSV
ncbi:MBL fold metallo-hydrolase [Alkalibacillus aidingensis]|uniref:MBL fold metallo-hydrolase n=1 Tax=Alkalibacillus aidingensis TaxID=2747607 RepID=UPI001660EBD1|nr:MBL fold metallo-hydrolase [Alkalibacillus aidingensis]